MSIGKGLALSVIGGSIAAAAWAAIAYFTGWEFGIIAWAVGALAGAGMAAGVRGQGGRKAGVLAGAVALIAIFAAKFVTVELSLDRWMGDAVSQMGTQGAKQYLCHQVLEEFEHEGRALSDPAPDAEFPPEVLKEADRQWGAMSTTEQSAFTKVAERHLAEDFAHSRSLLGAIAFVVSFGIFGWIWAAMAVATAYRLGSAAPKTPGEESEFAGDDSDEATILPTIGTGFALPEITKEPPRTKGFRLQPEQTAEAQPERKAA